MLTVVCEVELRTPVAPGKLKKAYAVSAYDVTQISIAFKGKIDIVELEVEFIVSLAGKIRKEMFGEPAEIKNEYNASRDRN